MIRPLQSPPMLLLWVAAIVLLTFAVRGLVRTTRMLRRCRRAKALLAKFAEQGQLTADEWRDFLNDCEALNMGELARACVAEVSTLVENPPTPAYTNRDSDGS